MMHAYDELYLGKARMTLAWMFDYGINCCDLDIESFYRMFLTSSYVHRFENGDCSVVGGLSGVELAQRVISEAVGTMELPEPIFALDKLQETAKERQMSRLQEYRRRIGLSQRELSERADVPLRTIQQYEQKQKNINHAGA